MPFMPYLTFLKRLGRELDLSIIDTVNALKAPATRAKILLCLERLAFVGRKNEG